MLPILFKIGSIEVKTWGVFVLLGFLAAILYTMTETAKLSGVDPRTYLREAATRAITTPGTVTLPSDLT